MYKTDRKRTKRQWFYLLLYIVSVPFLLGPASHCGERASDGMGVLSFGTISRVFPHKGWVKRRLGIVTFLLLLGLFVILLVVFGWYDYDTCVHI